MENKKEKKVKTIKCQRCNYIWQTKSFKRFVTCPDCLTKVSTKEYKP